MRNLFYIILIVGNGMCFSLQDSIVTETVDTTTTMMDTTAMMDTTGVSSTPELDSLVKAPIVKEMAEQKKTGPVLIKRKYEYKSQVRLGIAMMIFIAIIFSTAQSWNP